MTPRVQERRDAAFLPGPPPRPPRAAATIWLHGRTAPRAAARPQEPAKDAPPSPTQGRRPVPPHGRGEREREQPPRAAFAKAARLPAPTRPAPGDGAVSRSSSSSSSSAAVSPSAHRARPLPVPVSIGLLNAVTILWGSQHAVIKLALTTHDDGSVAASSAGAAPATLSFLRFAIAAVVCLPFVPRDLPALRRALRPGAELGLWMFLGYAAQAVGLLSTSAARSGFLLYLNVKLVPLFAAVFYGRRIPPRSWVAAAIALVGTALLSYDGLPPNVGDLWSVMAAAFSAMFILRLESASASARNATTREGAPEVPTPSALNAVSLVVVAALSAVWACGGARMGGTHLLHMITTDLGLDSAAAWLPVLYLAIVTTALTNWLQAVGQRAVRAEQAAVIFAMDPVYGALFAHALLRETFGPRGFAGAALIIIAAVLSNWQERDASRDPNGHGPLSEPRGIKRD